MRIASSAIAMPSSPPHPSPTVAVSAELAARLVFSSKAVCASLPQLASGADVVAVLILERDPPGALRPVALGVSTRMSPRRRPRGWRRLRVTVADRLVKTEYDFPRSIVHSAGKSLGASTDAQ
jgi:hypothetical protein